MAEYTLHYFPLYARGEPIRMLLAHADVQFEDNRITMDDWKNHKASMPNGQLPALELKDGTRVGQSNAIMRMLGMKYGYYPTDPMEAFKSDELSDYYLDIMGKVYPPFFKPEDQREAMYPEIFDNVLPKFLDLIDPHCAKGQFIVGEKLCVADFWIGGLYTTFFSNPAVGFAKDRFDAILAKYPNFQAYGERFAAANEKWISTRVPAPI